MLQLRALDTLGGGNRDWLKARHHFAVEAQGNPAHARLGNLVVWNDDEIAPHSGFPMHGHRDMEIVTYVREGVLQHEDSFRWSRRDCCAKRAGDQVTCSRPRRFGESVRTRNYSIGMRFLRAVTSPRLSSPSCSLPSCASASLNSVDRIESTSSSKKELKDASGELQRDWARTQYP